MIDQIHADSRPRARRGIAGAAAAGLLLALTQAATPARAVSPAHEASAGLLPVRAASVVAWSQSVVSAEVGASTRLEASVRPAAPNRGRPVRLELREAGDRSWRTVASTTTTRRGRILAEVPTTAAYRGQLRLHLPADAGRPAVLSRPRRVVVRQDPAVRAAEFEADVLARVNEARTTARWCGHVQLGPSPALAVDDRLALAARAYAQRMGTEGFFAHVSPDGDSPSDRAAAAGYDGPVGENIAAGQATPAEVVRGWLGSPGHCANIMDPDYTVIGVGFAQVPDSDYRTYWTQMFGFG